MRRSPRRSWSPSTPNRPGEPPRGDPRIRTGSARAGPGGASSSARHGLRRPADHHVVITDHAVEARTARGGRPRPRSTGCWPARPNLGERLIAVILTGTGSDGAWAPARSRRAAGRSSSRTRRPRPSRPCHGRCPPRWSTSSPTPTGWASSSWSWSTPESAQAEDDERLLAQFLDRVRERRGIDSRRTSAPRSCAASSAGWPPRPGDRRRSTSATSAAPGRVRAPVASFLIKVTEFFRDPELFELLRRTVLPEPDRRGPRPGPTSCGSGRPAAPPARRRTRWRSCSRTSSAPSSAGSRSGSSPPTSTPTPSPTPAAASTRRPRSTARPGRPARRATSSRSTASYEVDKAGPVAGRLRPARPRPAGAVPRIDLALCRNVLIYFTPSSRGARSSCSPSRSARRLPGAGQVGDDDARCAEHFVVEEARLKVYRRAGDRVLIPPATDSDTSPGRADCAAGAARRPGAGRAAPTLRGERRRSGPGRAERPPSCCSTCRSAWSSSIGATTSRRSTPPPAACWASTATAIGEDLIHLGARRAAARDELREAVAARRSARASRSGHRRRPLPPRPTTAATTSPSS